MGSGASLNYSGITPLFDLGIWRVHSGIQKSTSIPVSIWTLDYSKLKKLDKNKKERKHIIQQIASSVTIMSKVSHPNFLKIIEISNQVNKFFSFAAEPVFFPLSSLCNNYVQSPANSPSRQNSLLTLTADEKIYIIQQISFLIRFIHNDMKYALIEIVPSAFVFSENFQIKLCNFARASPASNDTTTINDTPYGRIFHLPFEFTPPEVAFKQPLTRKIDSFMFGIFAEFLHIGESPLSPFFSMESHIGQNNNSSQTNNEMENDMIHEMNNDIKNNENDLNYLNNDVDNECIFASAKKMNTFQHYSHKNGEFEVFKNASCFDNEPNTLNQNIENNEFTYCMKNDGNDVVVEASNYPLENVYHVVNNFMPEESIDILNQCLSSSPTNRPDFNTICVSSMFLENEIAQLLSELDNFTFIFSEDYTANSPISNQTKDQFKEYVSELTERVISNGNQKQIFSERIFVKKIFPLLIKASLVDHNLGSVSLNSLFDIIKATDFYSENHQDFASQIMENLKPLLEIKKPETLMASFLSHIDLIMDRTAIDKLSTYVQPIIMNAITSDVGELLSNGLQSIGVVIALVDKEALNSQILPQMLAILNKTEVPRDAVAIIRALKICLNTATPVFIANSIFPAIKKLWVKNSWISTASPIADLIEAFASMKSFKASTKSPSSIETTFVPNNDTFSNSNSFSNVSNNHSNLNNKYTQFTDFSGFSPSSKTSENCTFVMNHQKQCEAQIEVEMKVCATLALEIASNPQVDPPTQLKLLNYISTLCNRVKNERNLNPENEAPNNDNYDSRSELNEDIRFNHQKHFCPIPNHTRNRSAPSNEKREIPNKISSPNNMNSRRYTGRKMSAHNFDPFSVLSSINSKKNSDTHFSNKSYQQQDSDASEKMTLQIQSQNISPTRLLSSPTNSPMWEFDPQSENSSSPERPMHVNKGSIADFCEGDLDFDVNIE
ncbi:hypothetical protein TRFO_41117 [Tritrichomonas foetus]|uniref:Protein kinase domain-containing protein n=1 Tax=Tritrichomonas foetus TaxID=1144522 RepID=A0A1J4L5K5_9EUKA|nr:hypothetical protein TRFO_41117 [Tritrichomonas foetus]|eukprot:OHT17292.1 hypothetical protein TRFO_41117 [Tritrichomonas foetus]